MIAAALAALSVAAAATPIVIGEAYPLPSKVLGDVRTVTVHLPAHYGEPGRRFPVLVLLDGGAKEDFHPITGLAEIAAAYGAAQELIVVGVEGKDRRHDLTAPSTIASDLKAAPTSGGSAAYRRFLVQELKPWIAAHYAVSGRYGLIGESLAGLFTLETFLQEPGDFDDYIAVSPSLWWADQALSKEAAGDLAHSGFAGRTLRLSIGDEGPEMQAGMDRVTAALKTAAPKGVRWSYDPRPQERHDSIYVPAANAAIRWTYAAPKP